MITGVFVNLNYRKYPSRTPERERDRSICLCRPQRAAEWNLVKGASTKWPPYDCQNYFFATVIPLLFCHGAGGKKGYILFDARKSSRFWKKSVLLYLLFLPYPLFIIWSRHQSAWQDYEQSQTTVSWTQRRDETENKCQQQKQAEVRTAQATHQPSDAELLENGPAPSRQRK